MKADIAVYSAGGALALVVETMNRPSAPRQWASEFLRNLVSYYGSVPDARYFLLALPDSFYLWETSRISAAGGGATDARRGLNGGFQPHYRADARAALAPYIRELGRSPEILSERGFELSVSNWLYDITDPGLDERNLPRELHGLLFDSGLRRAISGGTVRTQTVS